MSSSPSLGPAERGLVRLLNTASGRALVLAGDVDDGAVDAFLRRYGREPVRIDAIDAGSVTRLSPPAVALVLDHLDAAHLAGRAPSVRSSPEVGRLISGTGMPAPGGADRA